MPRSFTARTRYDKKLSLLPEGYAFKIDHRDHLVMQEHAVEESSLDTLALLLKRYGRGRVLLFTGAGFSVGATNIASGPIPTGSQLITLLKQQIDDEDGDLGILSQLYVEQFGEHKLFDLLTTVFRARTIEPEHRALLSFPWRAIYTTNYDDVAETAATQGGITNRSYSQTDHPNDIDSRSLPIVHLNGYIHHINFNNFLHRIRLTNMSYISDDVSKSPWGQKFRADILTSPCIVFVGYSLYDLDIARVVYEFPNMRDRIYFITNTSPSRGLSLRLRNFGQVLDIGTRNFASYLTELLSAGLDRKEVYFTNIVRLSKFSVAPVKPKDADVRDLLVWGDVKQDILASEITTGSKNYFVERDCVARVVDLVQGSPKCNIVLRSNLGNGKSLCAEIIAHRLNNLHAEVFRIENLTRKLMEELPQVQQLDGKKIFIIDNLAGHIDTIKAIHSLNLSDYAIITCVKTSLYDLLSYEMDKLFGHNLFEFDLDTLSSVERANLISLFNTYGYWRELHQVSDKQKNDFVRTRCSSELRTVLLYFLDCQPIKSKIISLFGGDDEEEESPKIRSLITLSQMINLAGMSPRLDLLSDILGFDSYLLTKKVRSEYQDFFRVHDDSIALRSPILSEYIVKNIIDSSFLIDTMIAVVGRLDQIYHSDFVFQELMKTFVRFSFLEGYLPQRNRRDLLIKYYESVKVLNQFRTEPLFWLQYAMARLALREFAEAKLLFDAAYAFSKARHYTENRHLDNQYARYLIESRTYSDAHKDYMEAVNNAHQILMRQTTAELTSYNPYRIATKYHEFASARRDELTPGDRVRVQRACADILRRIGNAPERLKNYPAVRECESRLKEAAKILQ